MKLPKYVSKFEDNRGKPRARFRRQGQSIYLPWPPYSDAFNQAYAAALSGVDVKKTGAGPKPKAGTVNALVTAYYASELWRDLKATSQAPRRRILEKFREKNGDKPVAQLPKSWIKKEMERMADTPAQANRWLQLLQQILDFAIEEEWVQSNPARLVKKYRNGAGHKPWPEEEIAKFETRWPVGTKERLAFDIFLYTGQRIGDVAAMMRTHIRDGAIRVVQEKGGAELWIPIHPQLSKSLKSVPSSGLALIQRQTGQPYTKGGLDNWFRRKRKAANIASGLSPHGLRKAAGRRLADAGSTTHEIKAILGHSSLREVQRYTADADQRRNAQAGISKLSGTQKQQKVSSATGGVSSVGAKLLK